jgi:AAA15 family ATPase/GTPase
MLRSLECTGFKSFVDFHLTFKPGLNILVGPNGSGKTNIILLLEFLGILVRSPLIEAIGRVGGAGSIFRRQLDNKLSDTITFTVSGYGNNKSYRSDKTTHVLYKYSASIYLSTKDNTIAFMSQHLQMSIYPNTTNMKEDTNLYDESVDIKTDFFNDAVTTDIIKMDHTIIDWPSHRLDSREKLSKHQIQDAFVEMCKRSAKDMYLFNFLEEAVPQMSMLSRDLLSARSFNITPSQARNVEDIGTMPVIEPDGSGLAATLFNLQTAPDEQGSLFRYRYMYVRQYYENPDAIRRKILEYSRIVNPNITDIYVISDPIEAKLAVFIKISYEGGELQLPFRLVSDGTAKWFTLVTAIAANSNLFAIEEPENFLHPLMQIEIVKILREQYERAEQDRWSLISTHSETIINQCQPSEIIIVEMKRGRTEARRPSNSEELLKEITETGFGLGYYYIAGAVE